MYALTRPYTRERTALLDGTPLPVLTMLAALVIAAWVLAITGMGSPRIARAVGAGAAQGALLASAVAWTVVRPAATADLLPAGIALTVLAGSVAAALTPAGALVYLLAPLWLWRRRQRLPALGLDAAPPLLLVLGGIVLGATLGIHLMITASLTLGYRIVRPVVADLGPWLAYDVGANVLAAECFFRGALFNRAQRRWSFATATALCTAACVGRYLIDPLLPRTLEVAAGAAFYVALLSVGNCWLYWRSGSVVPGLAAGFVFFAVYRLLHGVR
jgi:hypothetical protein